jgi:hypothetical protein
MIDASKITGSMANSNNKTFKNGKQFGLLIEGHSMVRIIADENLKQKFLLITKKA